MRRYSRALAANAAYEFRSYKVHKHLYGEINGYKQGNRFHADIKLVPEGYKQQRRQIRYGGLYYIADITGGRCMTVGCMHKSSPDIIRFHAYAILLALSSRAEDKV